MPVRRPKRSCSSSGAHGRRSGSSRNRASSPESCEPPLRVLFANLNHSTVPGGVERWMIDAADGLVRRGHEALLVGRPCAEAPWLRTAVDRGLRIRDDHKGTWAERVVRLLAAMRRERPDVVVAKGKKAARIASWGRSLGGNRRGIFCFGLTGELRANLWMHRHTWARVDAGIVVAHGAARWYVDHGFGPRVKLHVLWKGVDLCPFDSSRSTVAATRATLGLAESDVAVVTIGRLAWQKGIDHLFAAVPGVRARQRGVRFFIVGGGGEAAQLSETARRSGLGDAVTFLGPREDVPTPLAAMDIVVLPSRHEVMAQTTLEAMAAGRPVVSTRTMGADEAIEDERSGVLVPVGAPEALADAVAALAGDRERRLQLGVAARRRVEEHFTMDKMVDRLEAILESVAGR